METDSFSRMALPIFLYNSGSMGEGGRFALNLFEPRYRNMCERIISGKLPPLMLFVPNFVDYIPRPGDHAIICRVACQPSHNGQYTMFGEEIEHRILELTWIELASPGLWFATSFPVQPQSKNMWQGTIFQTFRSKLVRRKEWNFRQSHISDAMDLMTFRLPLPEGINCDTYYTEIWNALSKSDSVVPSEQAQLAFGLQESAFALAGLNYPNGTARVFVRRDQQVHANVPRIVRMEGGGHHIPTTIMLKAVQLLREAITQAAATTTISDKYASN